VGPDVYRGGRAGHSARTLKHRKAKGERLTTEETERFLRVIRCWSGRTVFGDRDKLFRWLRSADELVDNRTSMSLLATESGAKRVEGSFGQLLTGVQLVNSLWRISVFRDLTGMGGEFSEGRWHVAAPGNAFCTARNTRPWR